MVLSNDIDLLHPSPEAEKRKHKLKRLVQSPNSFFMDVKCQGCFNMYALFLILKSDPSYEPLCLATLTQWWFVGTARWCCANRPAAALGSARVVLSGERVID
ncbi:hypothetical protein DM860_009496 [Cuscuta australis]|uniref:40S ribosomal protein S27 n=1 Tax=Cuscuta australis TaxID=267555 RepID=A0A328DIL8_9ASTE|nr:hypothetical protein DM860_009496 [Cuscuta australis]